MMHTADVKGDKPNFVLLQSISGLNAINPLVATTSMEYKLGTLGSLLDNYLYSSDLCPLMYKYIVDG
jgi:hypothetical protein